MVARRLAALLSLVFLATHCVEIDDRDLDEHDGDDDSGGASNGGSSRGGAASGGTASGGPSNGGGGGSNLPDLCQRDDDDTDCFACEKERCCSAYQACFASADCLDYVECGADCGADSVCIADCGRAYPEGEALFGAFTTCGAALCGDACGA
jgi:hypothetical protein